MTKTTLTYDVETCGRCGGTGHYSYNQIHGTVCYGCSGRKIRPTRDGKKAQVAINAFIAENFTVRAGDLAVGDGIRHEGCTRTITAIEFRENAGASLKDGVMVPYNGVTLTFNKPVPSPFGKYDNYGCSVETAFTKAVAGADWDKVVAFARTIKKGVTVVETEAPVVA